MQIKPEVSKGNAAQTLHSNLMLEIGALQIRIANAVHELNQIADLLADSTDLPVGQTAAVRLLNETIEALSGMSRNDASPKVEGWGP